MAALGRYRDALELIKKENPSRPSADDVCNRRCEAACTRGSVDGPLPSTKSKFIAEKDLEAEHRFVPRAVIPSNRVAMEKIAIIGAVRGSFLCFLSCGAWL